MNIKHPDLADIPSLRALWREAFGDTEEYLDTFFRLAFDPSRCLCIEAGKAACHWLPCSCRGQKIAYLYAVATAKDSRGQGLCRALLTQAQAVLCAQGFAGILLVPQKESLRPMYRKLGFQNATQISEFSTTAPLQREEERPPCARGAVSGADWGVVTPTAYAQARVALLPEGSAVEGPEFFAFLASQISFYRMGDNLFACAQEGDHLYIPELLGDPSAASAILPTFGATHATIRTPGQGRAWAMYCPLSDAPAPTHFSFAMD